MIDLTESELISLSALEQARLIRQGEISSLELTNIYLERIFRYNDTLQSFVSVQAKRARKAATRADRLRAGSRPEAPPRWTAVHRGNLAGQ